ncbi:hypothetical protein AX761_23380 [Rhizobium sp. 58]|nr:hypothetical protein AX761_23380 [Rhizobium sp. 58]
MKKNILEQEFLLPGTICVLVFILYLIFCYIISAGENWYVVGVCVFAAILYLVTYNKIFQSEYEKNHNKEKDSNE